MRALNILSIVGIFLFISCEEKPKQSEKPAVAEIAVPAFNPDSAYTYVKRQLDFGPRVPGTTEHKRCGDYLVRFLKSFADTVIEQQSIGTIYNGMKIPLRNIIASFNLEDTSRILLCSHWDTRPFADMDSLKTFVPIPGANDGASGVAVLMEIARQLKLNKSKAGVDIVFFDAEDWGKPGVENSYCLGSQYWSQNPHAANYRAQFGILLDMVGGKNATFGLEGNSERFAKDFLHEVWRMAHNLGYSDQFVFVSRPGILDDHYYINQNAHIPTIDIVQYDLTTESGFARYWHSHNDNLEAIDPKTLKAVGQTLMEVVWRK
jgi:glutaminyl-peptide cyclotransferase